MKTLVPLLCLIAALAVPLWIIIAAKRRFLAFIVSALLFWMMLFLGFLSTQWLNPKAEAGLALGMTLRYGWILGLQYAGFWTLVAMLARKLHPEEKAQCPRE